MDVGACEDADYGFCFVEMSDEVRRGEISLDVSHLEVAILIVMVRLVLVDVSAAMVMLVRMAVSSRNLDKGFSSQDSNLQERLV